MAMATMVERAEDWGDVPEAGTVVFRRRFATTRDRLWTYITESDKRATWLAAGPMDLRIGGAVELHFNHAKLSPTAEPAPDGASCGDGNPVTGRITRYDPPRLLSHTWPEMSGIASEVTYELAEDGDHVLLVLTHRRLDARAVMLSVASGWHTHLGILADQLAGRVPPPFWTTHKAMETAYQQRLP